MLKSLLTSTMRFNEFGGEEGGGPADGRPSSGESLDTDAENVENGDGYQDDLGDEGVPDAYEASGQDDHVPLDDADPHSDPGEAESLDEEEDAGALPVAVDPQLQQLGFSSWEEFGRFQYQRQLYEQSQKAYQETQQAAPQAQQQQRPDYFEWSPPVQLTPDVANLALTQSPQALKKAGTRKAEEALKAQEYIQENWNRWTVNPPLMVQELVIPALAPFFQQVQNDLGAYKAEQFRQRHQDLLPDGQSVDQFVKTYDGVVGDPLQAALELEKLRRTLRSQQSQRQQQKAQTLDRQAAKRSARGKPGKGKARRASKELQHKGTRGVGQAVLRQLLEAGEITPDQL